MRGKTRNLWRPSLRECLAQNWSLPAIGVGCALLGLSHAAYVGSPVGVEDWMTAAAGLGILWFWYSACSSAVISARAEPFCIRCGYILIDLRPPVRCPECGWQVSEAAINAFRKSGGRTVE